MNNTDNELSTLISNGDVKAFEQLYRRYYALLCRFSAQLLHSHALAEEVVDDVFFHIWENRTSLAGVQKLKAYLIRAVRNNSLRALEAPAVRAGLSHVRFSAEGMELAQLLADEGHPLGWLIEHELENCLREAIDELPEACRRVFVMSRMEGKRHADIARELGISENTVKYHVKSALKTLSTRLTPTVVCMLAMAAYCK